MPGDCMTCTGMFGSGCRIYTLPGLPTVSYGAGAGATLPRSVVLVSGPTTRRIAGSTTWASGSLFPQVSSNRAGRQASQIRREEAFAPERNGARDERNGTEVEGFLSSSKQGEKGWGSRGLAPLSPQNIFSDTILYN